MRLIKNNKEICRIWGMALIACLVLAIRAQYGFSFNDEPFIVSLAQRLYYGDSLYIDEWNFAQNAGVLLLPFFRLYVGLFHTTEGILIIFRGIYCVLWVFSCTVLYSTVRKKYPGAIVAYLYLLLFSPLDQMTLSYTSIGLMCTLLLCSLFFRQAEGEPMKSLPFTVIFSLLTVIAVIASPYMGIVYGAYVAGTIVFYFCKPTENAKFYLKSALWSIVIAGGAFVLYIWRFILNNYTIKEFIEKLPNMFATYSFGGTVSGRSDTMLAMVFSFWKWYIVALGALLILLVFKKIRTSLWGRLAVFSAAGIAFVVEIITLFGERGESPNLNLQMTPIAFLGVIAFLLLEKKKQKSSIVWIFGGFGMAYSLISYVSSDTGLMALSMGLSVCGVGSILLIWQLVQELRQAVQEQKRSNSADGAIGKGASLRATAVLSMAVVIFVGQIFAQTYLKIDRHYMDRSVPEMEGRIAEGPSRWIVTHVDLKYEYENRIAALDYLMENVDLEKKEEIRFLSLIFDPVLYVNVDLPIGCYSTWTHAKSRELELTRVEKMNRYYSVNPSKMPNVIFCDVEDERLSALDVDTENWTVCEYEDYWLLISPEFAD